MYKTDIIKKISKETRLSQRVVGDVIDGAVKAIQQALREGRTVTIPGFGTFYTAERKAGQATNFQTGEAITYPARRVASFRAGAVLKRAVRKQKTA